MNKCISPIGFGACSWRNQEGRPQFHCLTCNEVTEKVPNIWEEYRVDEDEQKRLGKELIYFAMYPPEED